MTTEDDCIRALREAAERLGESPTKAQYEQLDLTPSASTILRHCGGWNDAKERAGLETNPSTGSRVGPKPDDVDLPDGVEWAELSQDQRWHYRHREQNTRRTLERRQRLRRWLHTYRAERRCTQCGESDPACLDFHHRDGEQKAMAVNEMVLYGHSKAPIRSEIEKCDLLCANCHWREHHSRPDWMDGADATVDSSLWNGPATDVTPADLATARLTKAERLRAWTYAYQRERGCRRCDEDDPFCLQFHHVDSDKTLGIGAMISNSYPVEDVLAEVEKCTVLCANCHRREHYRNPVAGSGENDRP